MFLKSPCKPPLYSAPQSAKLLLSYAACHFGAPLPSHPGIQVTMLARILLVLAATASSTEAYRFMAIGDWGASYTPPSKSTSDTCAIDPSINCSTHGVSGCGYNEQQQMDGLQMGINAAKNKVGHVIVLLTHFIPITPRTPGSAAHHVTRPRRPLPAAR